MSAKASVIVRCMNKERTIGATLTALRRQSVPVEIVVVDSGSTDATVNIAKRYADHLIQILSSEFTYGGALNLGAEAASCATHVAISAHCVPMHSDWIERSVAHYVRNDVAGTNQASHTPTGMPIYGPYYQVLSDARDYPVWGFSNHASSWRASVWREEPFREDLGACEDKEWSWRVLAAGWTIAYDPRLHVPNSHRRKEGLVSLYRRHRREARALAQLGALPYPSYRHMFEGWWDLPRYPNSRFPHPVRIMSPYRVAARYGDTVGARTLERVPAPGHDELTGRPTP